MGGRILLLMLPGNTAPRWLCPAPPPPQNGSPLAIVIEPNPFWRFRVAAAERFLALAARSRLPIRARLSAVVPPEEGARRTYMLWAIDLEQAAGSEHEIGAPVFRTRDPSP